MALPSVICWPGAEASRVAGAELWHSRLRLKGTERRAATLARPEAGGPSQRLDFRGATPAKPLSWNGSAMLP
jgi:hypothetical protein